MIPIQVKTGVRMNAGYTMLFAVLVSTVLLSIGIFILNVSKKEVLLSSIGRESALAFYAADGGVECAHYHNTANPSLFNVGPNGSTLAGTISCGNLSITIPATTAVSGVVGIVSPATHRNIVTFFVGTLGNPGQCAEVRVLKDYVFSAGTSAGPDGVPPATSDSYSPIKTIIDSRGYNTCVPGDPRRVERGLRETIQ